MELLKLKSVICVPGITDNSNIAGKSIDDKLTGVIWIAFLVDKKLS